jgi:glycosyltransferase involved in cell wall biosynthesis
MHAIKPNAAILRRHGLLNRRFLLVVASTNPTKNLPALLAAFAALPRADGLCLVVVGGSNKRVFADAAGAADPPGVIRTGAIDDASLKALYATAAALVFPSLYEGFGLPPLEAMACSCPVAVARAASLPEVCGAAARYFDPRSIAEITAALCDVLNDAALRQHLQAAGLERAAEYPWSRPAAGLLAALGAGDNL